MTSVMNIPTGACPIAYPCLLSYRELANTSPLSMFRSNEEEWAEVEDMAADSNPIPETQRLRAFYALELTYHNILPQLFLTASDPRMHGVFLSLRAQRSITGLDELIELSARYKRRASAKRTSVALKDEGRDNSAQVVDLLKRHVTIVDQLVTSASKLRSSLKTHTTASLKVVGANLGRALFEANESESDVINQVHIILTINSRNAVTPWKQQTSEPISSQA